MLTPRLSVGLVKVPLTNGFSHECISVSWVAKKNFNRKEH